MKSKHIFSGFPLLLKYSVIFNKIYIESTIDRHLLGMNYIYIRRERTTNSN